MKTVIVGLGIILFVANAHDIHDVEKDMTIESDSSGSVNISGVKGIVSRKN